MIFLKGYLFVYFQRGKHQCMAASCMPPTGHLACNPGMCPRLRIEPATLWFSGWHSIHWATTTSAINDFFNWKLLNVYWKKDWLIFLIFFFFFKGKGGKKGGRETSVWEKHQLGCLLHRQPDRGPGTQPRHVPSALCPTELHWSGHTPYSWAMHQRRHIRFETHCRQKITNV